jgi:hypothetical protein
MLTFEPGFVSRLIALGRADAAAQPPQFWEQLARQGDGKPSAGCT